MESKDLKPRKDSVTKEQNQDVPVLQMRPDDSPESTLIPPGEEEVNAAVNEINPDENSLDSRG